MAYKHFSCSDIAKLLANKVTPDFNFKEQLWFIARANNKEAKEYLCLLLRAQFDFQPKRHCESFFHDCHNDFDGTNHRPFYAIVYHSNAKKIARRALILRDARQRLQNDPSPFPFLQLPFEIRLQVYKYAFTNIRTVGLARSGSFRMSQAWANFNPLVFQASKNEFGTDIDTALLLANRQISDEAEPILYQTRFIRIGVYLHNGPEVLESLSPRARRNIRAVHIELSDRDVHGRPFEFGQYNIEDWCKSCDYISQNLQLHTLSFNVPVEAIPANFADEAWVKYLIKIRELKNLVQRDLLTFIRDPEVTASSDGGSDSEPETESYQVFSSRLEALLSYLRSEMCRFPASRLLPEEEEKWDWGRKPRPFLGWLTEPRW